MAMLPELGAAYGVSPGTASLSLTAYLFPFAAVMLFSGTLGERWGRRRTVVTAYGAYVLASVACILATAFPVFLAARALQGAANAFTTPLLLSALAAAVPAQRLGRALGWFGSLQAAGQTSAPLLGGFAAEVDWRLAFGGVAVVAALLLVLGIPSETRPDAVRPGLGDALRAALRPEVLRAGVAAALGWGCLAGLSFLVALRLEEEFGVGAGPRGLLLTGLGVAGLLTARLVGGGVDRVGARRSVLLGAGLGAVVVVAVGVLPAVWPVALAWAVGGVATQLVLVGVNAMVLGTPGENRGGAVSVVQAVRFGGGALSPVAITPIYHADPLAGFLVPAALLAVAVPAALARGGQDPSTDSSARA
ncbi:putative MFS family arabinose efflux permease [Pseudonocardia kunmingensis]|uniref:Putative MFS family arabinose efflux permease n=1 Tax=Pseudonocardia kunmingensis TaxID=630975 RepID=A0A543D3I8_9PSEU|nr:putative MFS family arabinose efflux permease [Pseudonocardia kunmingensis]